MHSLPKRLRGYFSTFIRLILPRSILEAFLHFIFCLTLCVWRRKLIPQVREPSGYTARD